MGIMATELNILNLAFVPLSDESDSDGSGIEEDDGDDTGDPEKDGGLDGGEEEGGDDLVTE